MFNDKGEKLEKEQCDIIPVVNEDGRRFCPMCLRFLDNDEKRCSQCNATEEERRTEYWRRLQIYGSLY